LPKILRSNPKLHLICVGGGAFTVAEQENMEKLGVQQHITHTFADDEELAALYRGAAAFVFPSLYEGFGMPILEAMACGCPVVLSRASAFPEVAADVALYFDPKQPKDLARVVNELLSSSDLQTKLRTAGHARAASFTWKRAAEQILGVYKRVLEAL
jgi:glycosyltransferase involved in cell wall biosynthesis